MATALALKLSPHRLRGSVQSMWELFNSLSHRQVHGALRNEFEYDRNAVPCLLNAAAQGGYDVGRLRDAFSVAAQRTRQIRVGAADTRRTKPFGCRRH